MLEAAGERDRLAGLRRQIARVQGAGVVRRPALAFGIPALDDHLPAGGLRLGALHEVSEAGAAAEYAALSALFAASILARLPGEVVWCLKGRDLFAPALAQVGLHPHRVLFVETGREAAILPALEEALHQPGLAAVVGEVARFGLTASRRLQLAAERTGALAIAVRRWRTGVERQRAESEPTAAVTRWRVSPEPGTGPPTPGLSRARWRVELTRAKGAPPHAWTLEAPDAQGCLRLPAHLVHRPLAPPQSEQRARLG